MSQATKHITVPTGRTQIGAQFGSFRAGLRCRRGPSRTHVADHATYDEVRFSARGGIPHT